jgi:hypothetical protein
VARRRTAPPADDWPGLGPAGRAQRAQLERRLGRPIRCEPGDAEALDRIAARARQLDPQAFAEPQPGPRLEQRRVHAWSLALDEDLVGGNPAVAAVLNKLAGMTRN